MKWANARARPESAGRLTDAAEARLETTLYAPVKRFLESLGFVVKGEIGGCDVVGLDGQEPPIVVVCELKLAFNLDLLLQGIERLKASDEVWLAARRSKTGRGRESDARFRTLCRRLGFGLLAVGDDGRVDVLVNPDAAGVRRDPKRRSRLVAEHRRRKGDPALGGSTRTPVMTAYRQLALACAAALAEGPRRPRDLRPGIPEAHAILYRNVYGWFERAGRGVYTITDEGRAALARWPNEAVSSLLTMPPSSP